MQLPANLVNNHAYCHFDRAKRAEKSIPTNLAEGDSNNKQNSTVLISVNPCQKDNNP